MFISALFTTGKNWIEPKCPSTGEWIYCCIPYNGMLHIDKKEQTTDLCKTDGPQKHSAEQKKPDKKEFTPDDCINVKLYI